MVEQRLRHHAAVFVVLEAALPALLVGAAHVYGELAAAAPARVVWHVHVLARAVAGAAVPSAVVPADLGPGVAGGWGPTLTDRKFRILFERSV